MFEDEENKSAITWTFARTDTDGVTTTSSFTADTWPFALQQFVNFLKGSGYGVDDKSIGINGDKHLPKIDDIEVDHGWYGELFYPGDTAESPTAETQDTDGWISVSKNKIVIVPSNGDCILDVCYKSDRVCKALCKEIDWSEVDRFRIPPLKETQDDDRAATGGKTY